MAIKLFTFLLLIISLGAYFIPVENMKKNIVDKDAPLVIFESPFMYTINEENINRVIYATHAIKYENRDEMRKMIGTKARSGSVLRTKPENSID